MNKFLTNLSLAAFLLASFDSMAREELVRSKTCQKTIDEQVLSNSDFPWNQTLEEIKLKASELYISPKRLLRRAYVNSNGKIVLPIETFGRGVKEAVLTANFIKSVRLHVEEALKRRYVDAIIFSDMGHSHFFIPQQFYDRELDPIPVADKHLLYQKMLAHPELKILYHTAEQLKMKNGQDLDPDRHIQWRFFTRNLVGDNKAQGKLELLHAQEHRYNTAHDYDEGYRYWGGGFYISANKNGCFPFTHQGETFYFDLNLDGFAPGN